MTNSRIKFAPLKTIFLTGLWIASISCAIAQQSPNNFFGTMPGTTGPNQSYDDPPGTNTPPPTKLPAAGGDYTADEKRMQKKYKEKIRTAENLIAKGTRMMKSGNQKEAKHGQVIKEIGERNLAELKANSPFPDKPDKSGKSKTN